MRWVRPRREPCCLKNISFGTALRPSLRRASTRLQIPDYLKIAVSDVMPFRLSDLSDPKAQPFFDDVIADAELIIVDNLSTICP